MTNFLAGVLVLITGFYAWVTFRILGVNQRMIEAVRDQLDASLRPYVTVGLILDQFPIFHLRVANDGKTGATDLRLTISRDFFSYGDKRADLNLAMQNDFNKAIPSFPPGSELIFPLAQGFVIFSEGADPTVTPTQFFVTAKYSYAGKQVEERTDLDLTAYLMTAPRPNVQIDELKKIRETLEALVKART